MNLNKRKYFYLILISLLIRLFITFFVVDDYNSVEDYQIAQNLALGNGYVLLDVIGPTAIKAPFYPLLLSLFIIIFGSLSKIVIVIFQHLIILTSGYFILKIGELTQKIKISEIIFFIFIFYPPYLYYPNVIEVTNIFIFEAIFYIYLSLKYYSTKSNKYLIYLSILSGIIFLTQPIAMPIIVISWIFLLKHNLKLIITPILIVIVLQSPWVIRNYIAFDKFIPFKSPFWMNFYLGYHLPGFSNEKFDIVDEKYISKIDSLINNHVNDVEMEQHYKEAVLNTIKKDPVIYLEKTIFQIFTYWWVPGHYLNDNRLEFWIVRKLPVLFLNLLTIISLIYLYKSHPKLILSIVFILLYYTLTYGLTQTSNIRYKMDIEWLQFLPISMYLERFFKRKSIF